MAFAAYWYVLGSYYALSSARHFDDFPKIAAFVHCIIII